MAKDKKKEEWKTCIEDFAEIERVAGQMPASIAEALFPYENEESSPKSLCLTPDHPTALVRRVRNILRRALKVPAQSPDGLFEELLAEGRVVVH